MLLIKKKNNCGNCTYNRSVAEFGDPFDRSDNWCSNNSSDRFTLVIGNDLTCDGYVQKGKKAPLWMRILNKIL